MLSILLLTTNPAWAALPTPWLDADIGSPGLAGSAAYTNGGWTIIGGGSDVWNAADQFNLASVYVNGDSTNIALVTSLQNSDPATGWSKAGLMFRNDSSAGSPEVSINISAKNGVDFQWRSTSGGTSLNVISNGINAPVWLQLVRSNQTFTGYYKTNTAWIKVGSQQVTMAGTAMAGLDVTAHNNSALNTATFTNVTLSGLLVTNTVITNLAASSVLGTSAVLNGQVIVPGASIPSVTIYYGTSDGGLNAASWADSISLGQLSGNFSASVSTLSTNTTYYFSAFASNSSGVTWAQPSLSFTTLASNPFVTRVPVLTYHYDNTRQAADTNETLLMPANVNTNTFGKLFSYVVDGYVYAEPLLMTNVMIPGNGTHNVVFVATEHDTLYAFDADSNAGATGGLLWKTNLGLAALSTSAPFGRRFGTYNNIVPEVGMTGTPVIDPATGTIYADAFTSDIGGGVTNYVHRIHALDVTTGIERPYSPVIVAGSVPGTGVGSVNGVLAFSPVQHMNRPALCLANGMLVVGYGSYADTDPYHGWVFAYNATNLALQSVFCTTPNAATSAFGANAGEGALWMGGAGICVDSSNNLYFVTGNGSFSAQTNGVDYGDSFLKLSTTNGLAVADYFTPNNQAALAAGDFDLGSGGAALLPDSAGSPAHPHLIVAANKSGGMHLVDRDNMGHCQPGSDSQIVQSFTNLTSTLSPPAYWNNLLFFQPGSSAMKAFSISNASINQVAAAVAPSSVGSANGGPVVSANGTNNGIVWVKNNGGGTSTEILYALNATNISQMLWSSAQLASRDGMGNGVKMTTPTVASGKVYVGGQYTLSVFGVALFLPAPSISPSGGVFTNSTTILLADSAPGATIYYTLDGTTPTAGSTPYTGPFAITGTAVIRAIAMQDGYANSGVASASFINSVSLPPPPWQTSDVGPVATAGIGTFTNGVFVVSGSGSDVGGPGDGFRFIFQLITNNCDVSARVASQVNTDPWAKAGVMVRDSLASNSAYVFMMLTPSNGFYAQFRSTNGIPADGSVSGGALNPAPNNWVRLTRTNNILTSYKSPDGANWTLVNTATLLLTNSGCLVGLAATAHTNSALSTATFDYVTLNGFTWTNPPPAVVLTGPAANSTYTADASVTLSADADALYDSIAQVSFFANSVFVGSVSNLPYIATVAGLGAGSYTLTAVALSSSGLMSTSVPVTVTVVPGTGQPYGLTSRAVTPAFFNMPPTSAGSLPALLSQAGVFSNTFSMTPMAGLIPYTPNTPLWSDAALKTRYAAVPRTGGALTPSQQVAFAPTGSWTFPAGSVFVKTFELNTDTSDPNVLRRLETRLLVRDINGAVYGVTYKWRPDNSDADLLSASLSEDVLTTNVSGVTTQTWYYPSPTDCLQCHTPVANYVLGLNTRQLNGSQAYPATGVTDNQLRTFNRLGLFNPSFDEAGITNFEKLSALGNINASYQERARSYLDANCAHCHQPGGAGITFDARYDTPLTNQNLIYGALDSDGFAMIVPRDIWRSEVRLRMNTTANASKMPPLARGMIDTNAVSVMEGWINSLPGTPALAPPIITPNGGSFFNNVGISLQAPDPNAAIYFTLDGSTPTTNSLLYSGAFTLTSNTIVSASAFEVNYVNSVSASAAFSVIPLQFTSAHLANGTFQLHFVGSVGSNYVLQASTNLLNWTPIATNPATTNVLNFIDPAASNYTSRFYRMLQQ